MVQHPPVSIALKRALVLHMFASLKIVSKVYPIKNNWWHIAIEITRHPIKLETSSTFETQYKCSQC